MSVRHFLEQYRKLIALRDQANRLGMVRTARNIELLILDGKLW